MTKVTLHLLENNEKKGEVIIKWVSMVIRLKKNILFTRNMMICVTEIRKDLPPVKAHEENCGIYNKLYPQQYPAEQPAAARIGNRKRSRNHK